jgi:hypothetical protein
MQLLIQFSLFSVELGVILLALVVVVIAGRRRLRWPDSLFTLTRRLASQRKLAVAFSFVLPLVLRLLMWPFLPVPAASIHDEFSYLLMADTFAHGRLTNPTHPLWIHFDTIHVLQHPTYASIYPVMQGLFLAAGQVVLHNPWLGVWLSVALMCAAFCWALQACVPPLWALGGAALAAVRLGMFSYWMNSYWGGALAAFGGALVLGALPRVIARQRPRDAAILGVGMAVLANSRPYEGFAFCIPVAIVFLAWVMGADDFCRRLGFRRVKASDLNTRLQHVVVPIAIVLTGAALLTGYYFWRVTGSPTTMPYVVEAQQYGVTPLFRWQALRPSPTYSDGRMRYFYSEWAAIPVTAVARLIEYWAFYLGPVLIIPLLVLPHLLRDRRIRFPLIACGFVVVAVAAEWWAQPHYAAPATVAGYAVILQGIRYLRCMPRNTRWRKLWQVVPATVLLMVALRVAMPYVGLAVKPVVIQTWASMLPAFNKRYQLQQRLERIGGKHLVLVRYTGHDREPNIHSEWVYNAADIDDSQIVWAREPDQAARGELLNYFPGRQVWIADPDLGTVEHLQR